MCFVFERTVLTTSYRLEYFFFQKLICTAEAPSYDQAKEKRIIASNSSGTLSEFYDEMVKVIPIRKFSTMTELEQRLSPTFRPELVFRKFLVEDLPDIRVVELAPFTYHSAVVEQEITLKRFMVYIMSKREIAAIRPTEQTARRQAYNRYALHLLGYLENVAQNDAAIRTERQRV